MTNGIWLLPTRDRPDKALALLERCPNQRIILIVNKDDPELTAYHAIANAMFTSESEGMAAKCQEFFAAYPTYDWYGVLTDDLEPVTEDWADKLTAQLTGWNIVASDDGWQHRLQGAVVFSGDLLRAVGYIAPPKLRHLYFDDMWELLGAETGCLRYDHEVLVNHAHANITGDQDATARKVGTFWAEDEHTYRLWHIGERIEASKRITSLMRSKGLDIPDIDLRRIKLLISTPCGTGKFDDVYVLSLLKAVMALRQWGAHVDWHRQKGASDLPLARAMLFGTFYRSPYTHMLQIDDDMGFEPYDIARLLMLRQPFIAAAGPRKAVDGVQKFAFSNTDDFGNVLPVHQHADTGVLDISEVGGAFVMIDQECARRMVEAYSNLEFISSDGRSYWDLYLPFVLNKRHFGEDFAFCYRWRAIGGKVLMLPDVRLQHAGSYTWAGAASDYVNFELQQAQAAE